MQPAQQPAAAAAAAGGTGIQHASPLPAVPRQADVGAQDALRPARTGQRLRGLTTGIDLALDMRVGGRQHHHGTGQLQACATALAAAAPPAGAAAAAKWGDAASDGGDAFRVVRHSIGNGGGTPLALSPAAAWQQAADAAGIASIPGLPVLRPRPRPPSPVESVAHSNMVPPSGRGLGRVAGADRSLRQHRLALASPTATAAAGAMMPLAPWLPLPPQQQQELIGAPDSR